MMENAAPANNVRASFLALVSLLHANASRQAGVRVARALAFVSTVSTLGTIAWLAHRFGPDNATLRLASWGALWLSCVAGGVEGLALANRGRSQRGNQGLVELALARGLTERAARAAEVTACMRGFVEVVALPIVAIAAIVAAMTAGRSLDASARVLTGTAVFGVLVAVVLGLLAGSCRLWAGSSGRLWFTGIIVVPWVAGSLVWNDAPHAWLSVPGLVERAWRALTSS